MEMEAVMDGGSGGGNGDASAIRLFEIKDANGKVLFAAEAACLRAAVADAARTGVSLRGAQLQDADLRGLDAPAIDLRDADLSEAMFGDFEEDCGANLRGAKLRGANLYCTNFAGADLRGADLRDVGASDGWFKLSNLRGADLRRGQFVEACFQQADLQFADFRGADVCGASFGGANLLAVNLSNANCDHTEMGEVLLQLTPQTVHFGERDEATGLAKITTQLHLEGASFEGASLWNGLSWEEYVNEAVPALLALGLDMKNPPALYRQLVEEYQMFVRNGLLPEEPSAEKAA